MARRLTAALVSLFSLRCAALVPSSVKGVLMQSKIGELRFEQATTTVPSIESLVRGQPALRLGGAAVSVALHYGQLTRGAGAGTRVLVKEYSAHPRSDPEPAERTLVETLEASLEASPAPAAIAEAMAQTEFVAHCRVQGGSSDSSYGRTGVLGQLLGQEQPATTPTDDGTPPVKAILNAFPWYGERVRMALPTAPPPTLASWMGARSRGQTVGAYWDKSVPKRACLVRGQFARKALRDALEGLRVLHEAQIVHCSVGAASVLVSSEDDRIAQSVRARLLDLSFCRDRRSLELLSRCDGDGVLLPALCEISDPLETGLRERADRLGSPLDFGAAEDMRAFGVLLLQAFVLPNAPPTQLSAEALAQLTEGPFALDTLDGTVDLTGLREYLVAEGERLQIGGVGGVELLDSNGRCGWDLLESLLGPNGGRASAARALEHRFWKASLLSG